MPEETKVFFFSFLFLSRSFYHPSQFILFSYFYLFSSFLFLSFSSLFLVSKEQKKSNKNLFFSLLLAWNPLFIRSDAVVDSIAFQYNMNKADILDIQSKNLVKRK